MRRQVINEDIDESTMDWRIPQKKWRTQGHCIGVNWVVQVRGNNKSELNCLYWSYQKCIWKIWKIMATAYFKYWWIRVFFKEITFRKPRHGIRSKQNTRFQIVARKTCKLDNGTLMSVVSVLGRTQKAVFVFPARELHYWIVEKDNQTALDFLSDCYFYQSDISGVDN